MTTSMHSILEYTNHDVLLNTIFLQSGFEYSPLCEISLCIVTPTEPKQLILSRTLVADHTIHP